MKQSKSSKVDQLAIDVVEYAFVEWLIRRGIFTAYMANYDCTITSQKTFRDCLRDFIRHLYCSSSFGPEALISAAFLFDSTPEGYEFWFKHSDAWECFYNEL